MEYLIVFLLLLIGIFRYDIYGCVKYRKSFFYFLCFLFWGLAAFRYRIGNDTADYMYEYRFIYPLSESNWENLLGTTNRRLGWNLFVGFCKEIGKDYVIYQLFHATIVSFAVIHVIKKYSTKIFISLFLYFILFYMMLNFDAMREALAVSVFLCALHFYVEKKWIKYCILAFIATLFHISALFICLLPLVQLFKVNKLFILISGITVLFVLSVFPYINDFFLHLSFLEDLGNVGAKATHYLSKEDYQALGTFSSVMKLMVLYVCFPFILIIYYYKRSSSTTHWIIPLNLLFILLSVLNVGSPLFYRFQNYLYIVYVILISNCCGYFLQERHWQLLKRQILVLAVLFFTIYYPLKRYYLPSPNYPDVKVYSNYYPYYSVFSKETDKRRESIKDAPEI